MTVLNALFNRVKNFLYEKTHYNPTELPGWAIDRLCEISKTEDSISLELDMHGYRSYLTDIGFELPPFREMLHSANKGNLKEFLMGSVNSRREISMFADSIDPDAIRLGYYNEEGEFCKYKDLKTAYEKNPDEFEPEVVEWIMSL